LPAKPIRPDFRATAARRLAEAEQDLSPSIISLLSAEGPQRPTSIRTVSLDDIEPNPDQPRLSIDQEGINELTASVKEHGVLQPILVRPLPGGRYQLIAGERRWRASRQAGLETIPAMVEQIDDDTALEIAIIENLQREDLSPLDEAVMYERMTREHGYSVRKLAQKIGKDKGYIENRLRLADAPSDVRQLVSLRKDTVSHAYELLKVDDSRKRQRLAGQVARGELSLVKLRERIEGRPRRVKQKEEIEQLQEELDAAEQEQEPVQGELIAPLLTSPGVVPIEERQLPPPPPPPLSSLPPLRQEDPVDRANAAWTGVRTPQPITEDSLVDAKGELNDALERLMEVLRATDAQGTIDTLDRSNLAKYLTIAKLRLENAIALVRSGDPSLRQ
jgi:ParB family transcriptional regulator, chromosome partitioning protein